MSSAVENDHNNKLITISWYGIFVKRNAIMAILSEQSVHLGNVGVNDPPEVRRVGGDMERSVRPPGHKYLLAGDSLSFYRVLQNNWQTLAAYN